MGKLFDMLDRTLEAPSRENVSPPKENETNGMTASDWEERATASGGLSSAKAQQRLMADGKNELAAKRGIHPAAIFFGQYKDIMTVILLVCTAASLFMGEYIEAIAIAIIVLMNGILGFIQEYRTEKTLEALRGMAAPTAKVLRDGGVRHVPADELVRGDTVLLEAGDRIPADGRLMEAVSMECDESMLTGESLPVKKDASDGGPSGQLSMGCTVTRGHGRFLITETGMATRMGGIASMLGGIEEDTTPLQKKLGQMSKIIAVGCLLICLIVSVTGIFRGENFLDMLITGVSLAVAAVPEGLTAVVTIALALSVSRMVKRNALVRRLHAVESLGCATVICTDKTGTLTQNRMTVTEVRLPSGSYTAEKFPADTTEGRLFLEGIVLCGNATLGGRREEAAGGPTELALLRFAKRWEVTREELFAEWSRLEEQPFDSRRKRMSVLVQNRAGERILFVKGAADVLLEHCTQYRKGRREFPLLPSEKRKILNAMEEMADGALRVIGVACRKAGLSAGNPGEEGLTFLGMAGLIDPPRPEVKRAVSRCHKAGIRTVMITGDHKRTAAAIGRQVGIYHDGDRILTGDELSRMNVDELAGSLSDVTVFARVSPEHKLQIVRAFKKKGQIVAMTGDGVNDAPAVKEADIGVSMGKSGTDVTKEASDIILLDDNFATLVNAVDEGRSIYQNIRKFIRYLLSCNIGEVLTMFLGMLFGMPIILFPIQILLVNLVTDGLPAIALSLEPPEQRAMSRPPRRPDESVFSGGLGTKIVIRGIFIGLSTLASFVAVYAMTGTVAAARTAALFALIFAQLLHVFECKSEEKHIFQIPYGDNKKLLGAVLLSFITLLLVIYFPPLRVIFRTVPLTLWQLLAPIGFCLIAPLASAIFHKKLWK